MHRKLALLFFCVITLALPPLTVMAASGGAGRPPILPSPRLRIISQPGYFFAVAPDPPPPSSSFTLDQLFENAYDPLHSALFMNGGLAAGVDSTYCAIASSPTGATESGTTVTITCGSAHGYSVGSTVLISGVGVSGYNGQFVIASTPSNTTFTYVTTATSLAASGSGSALSPAYPNATAILNRVYDPTHTALQVNCIAGCTQPVSSPATNGVVYTNSGGALFSTATGGAGTLCLVSANGGTPSFGSCSGTSSTAFSAITASTNAGGGSFVVGSGSNFSTTGTGTIAATSVTGLSVVATKTLTVNNSVTLAGTDGTTMTFPTTTATLARTDAGNTFLGHQTIEGVTSTGATGTGNLVFSTSPTFSGTLAAGSITASSQITSNVSTGTAPFVVASTTNVPNLNASSLNGATFAAPGDIGLGTQGKGAFTTVTGTSFNKVAITTPATGSTLTIADGKTLTASNSLTLIGTDATTQTFPTSNAIIARTDAGQTFTGTQTFSSTISGSINGSAAAATNFTGSLGGDVTGLQGSTVVASAHITGGTNTELAVFNASGNLVNYPGTATCTGAQVIQTLTAAGVATCITPTGSGTVTHSAGGLAAGQLVIGNGSADVTVGNLSGDVTTPGTTVATVVQIEGAAIPTSAAVVGTNGSKQLITATVPLTSMATQAADTVLMNASMSAAAPTAVPMPTTGTNGCGGAANALIYNTGTHVLACNQNIATAFGNLTTGTNSSAVLTVGTGGSITVGGTGVNNANQVNAGTFPASKTIVGTNSSAQLVDATSATLSNNTTGNAATATTAVSFSGVLAGDVTGNQATTSVGGVHFSSTPVPFSATAPGKFQQIQFNGTNLNGITGPVLNAGNYAAGSNTGGIVEAYVSSECPSTGCEIALNADTPSITSQTLKWVTGKPMFLNLDGHTLNVACTSGDCLDWIGDQSVLTSGTYTSGGSITGSVGNTCSLTAFNGGGSGATATVVLTSSNTIAGGSALIINTSGSGYTSAPTSATLSSGTATCSGTAVVSTAIGGLNADATPAFRTHSAIFNGKINYTGSSSNIVGLRVRQIANVTIAGVTFTGFTTSGATPLVCDNCHDADFDDLEIIGQTNMVTLTGALAVDIHNSKFYQNTGTLKIGDATAASSQIAFHNNQVRYNTATNAFQVNTSTSAGNSTGFSAYDNTFAGNGDGTSSASEIYLNAGSGSFIVNPFLQKNNIFECGPTLATNCNAPQATLGSYSGSPILCSTTGTPNVHLTGMNNYFSTPNAATVPYKNCPTGNGMHVEDYAPGLTLPEVGDVAINQTSGQISAGNLNAAPLGTAIAGVFTGDSHASDIVQFNTTSGGAHSGVWVDGSGNLNFKGNTASYQDGTGATYAHIDLYGGNSPNAQPYIGFFKSGGSNPVKLYGDSARIGVFADSAAGDYVPPTTASVVAPELGLNFLNFPHGPIGNLPATCTQGDEYFATNATAGQNNYYCTATNTWTAQSTGAGGTGFALGVPFRQTARTAAISPAVTIATPSAAGQWNVSLVVHVSTADASGKTVTCQVGWTMDGVALSVATVAVPVASTNNFATVSPQTIYPDASTAITYACAVSGAFSTAQYDVAGIAEQFTSAGGNVGTYSSPVSTLLSSSAVGNTDLGVSTPASPTPYTLHYYIWQTTAGSGCTGNATASMGLNWTDPTGGKSSTSSLISMANSVLNTNFARDSISIIAGASSAFSYFVTFTNCTGSSPTQPKYSAYAWSTSP